MPDPTQPMPPAQPPQQPPGVPAGQAQPPGRAPGAPQPVGGQGHPVGGSPAAPPVTGAPYAGGYQGAGGGHQGGGPPPGPVPPGGPGGPERRPGMWSQATSTTGGKVATTVALVMTGVLLLGLLAVGVFAAARIGDRFEERRGNVANVPDGWPDMRPRGDADDTPRRGNGNGMMRGSGPRDFLLPGGGLGAVQHGEFTATGTDGKPVVLTIQRGAVTAASATSVGVRSADGFAQTYTVNTATRVGGGSAEQLAAGDQIIVVARKDGRLALQIWRDRSR